MRSPPTTNPAGFGDVFTVAHTAYTAAGFNAFNAAVTSYSAPVMTLNIAFLACFDTSPYARPDFTPAHNGFNARLMDARIASSARLRQ